MPVMDDWIMDCPWWIALWIILQAACNGSFVFKPNVAGDQWSEKQNTKQTQISFDLQHKV